MREFLARMRGSIFIFTCKVARKNVKIARGLRIYKKLKVTGKGSIEIGENCRVCGIKGDSSQYVCLETLSPTAVMRIGNNVSLYAARIAAKYQIVIGDDVLIEEAGIMDTDFHSIARDRGIPLSEKGDKCRVMVGNRVCIGARSSILKGTTIGDDVIVAPGSIVTMSVKSGYMVAGNPAKALAHE